MVVAVVRGDVRRTIRVADGDARRRARGGPGASTQAAFWASRLGEWIALSGEIDRAACSTRQIIDHAWRRLVSAMRMLGFEAPARSVPGPGCRR